MGGQAAFLARLGRQRAIPREAALVVGDALPAFSAGGGGQFPILKEASFLGRNALSSLSGNRALLIRIHGGEAAVGRALCSRLCHLSTPVNCVSETGAKRRRGVPWKTTKRTRPGSGSLGETAGENFYPFDIFVYFLEKQHLPQGEPQENAGTLARARLGNSTLTVESASASSTSNAAPN